MVETLTDRLRKLKGRMSLADFGQIGGASAQAADKWLKGGNVTDQRLAKIAKHFNVSVQWLRYGDAASKGDPSGAALEIALAFDKLSPAMQSSVRTLIFAIASSHSVARWLMIEEPKGDGYRAWERAVERAYEAEMKQLQLNL